MYNNSLAPTFKPQVLFFLFSFFANSDLLLIELSEFGNVFILCFSLTLGGLISLYDMTWEMGNDPVIVFMLCYLPFPTCLFFFSLNAGLTKMSGGMHEAGGRTPRVRNSRYLQLQVPGVYICFTHPYFPANPYVYMPKLIMKSVRYPLFFIDFSFFGHTCKGVAVLRFDWHSAFIKTYLAMDLTIVS